MSKEISEKEIFLEEYKSLRDETIARIEASSSILNLTFVAIGGLLTVAATITDERANTLFALYPYLALFLALGYASNAVILNTIGHYIREELEEKKIQELYWASYFNKKHKLSSYLHILSTLGIFTGSAAGSLYIYCLKTSGSNKEAVANNFIFFVCLAILLNFIIILVSLFYKPSKIPDKVKAKEDNKTAK